MRNRVHRSSSRPRRRVGTVLAVTTALLGSLAFVGTGYAASNDPPRLANPDRTAERLVTRFITQVADQNVQGLQRLLSPAFQLQRADGSAYDKSEYLANLPTIGNFEISDLTATKSGPVLVARWSLAVEATIDGRPQNTAPAPRLSAFAWENGRWRLAAYANFNTPAS